MDKQEPGFRQMLTMDVQRHRELFGKHPLNSKFKIWLSMFSPRFVPVLLCRLAYKSHTLGCGTLARIFSLLNFLLFGIEIATTCKIGPGLFFPHTHGTVIGAVSIGKNAIIYQGVTLGARDLDFTFDTVHRPVVGDDVFFGAGAKVLGGLQIGNNVVVAANAVLLESAPDDVVVGGIPAKIIKHRKG